MHDTQTTVILDRAIDDALEELLSPMDEFEFLNQLDRHLPKVHRPVKPSMLIRLRRPSLRIYRGLAAWCGIHFHYVQFDYHLHILRIEPACDADRDEADTLLGELDSQGIAVTELGNGLSIASH